MTIRKLSQAECEQVARVMLEELQAKGIFLACEESAPPPVTSGPEKIPGLLLRANGRNASTVFADVAGSVLATSGGQAKRVSDTRPNSSAYLEATQGVMYWTGEACVRPGYNAEINPRSWSEVRARNVTINPRSCTIVVIGNHGATRGIYPFADAFGQNLVADYIGNALYTQGPSGHAFQFTADVWYANKSVSILTCDGNTVTSKKDSRSCSVSPNTLAPSSGLIADPVLLSPALATYLTFRFAEILIYDRPLTADEEKSIRSYAASEHGYDESQLSYAKPILCVISDAVCIGGYGSGPVTWPLVMADQIGKSYRVLDMGAASMTSKDIGNYRPIPPYVTGSHCVLPACTFYDIALNDGRTAEQIRDNILALASTLESEGWNVWFYPIQNYGFTVAQWTVAKAANTKIAEARPGKMITMAPKQLPDGTHWGSAAHSQFPGEIRAALRI